MATSYLHPPASSQVRKMLLLHVAMNRAGAFSVRSRSKICNGFWLQFKWQHHVCHKGFPEFTIHFYDSTLPSFAVTTTCYRACGWAMSTSQPASRFHLSPSDLQRMWYQRMNSKIDILWGHGVFNLSKTQSRQVPGQLYPTCGAGWFFYMQGSYVLWQLRPRLHRDSSVSSFQYRSLVSKKTYKPKRWTRWSHFSRKLTSLPAAPKGHWQWSWKFPIRHWGCEFHEEKLQLLRVSLSSSTLRKILSRFCHNPILSYCATIPPSWWCWCFTRL